MNNNFTEYQKIKHTLNIICFLITLIDKQIKLTFKHEYNNTKRELSKFTNKLIYSNQRHIRLTSC